MTQQQTDRLDWLVEDYLGAVSYACGDLSSQRRDELVEDLREHIAAARAVLHEPTEAAVRTILDRLGEPTVIAEEARLSEGLPVAASTPVAVQPREVARSSTATLGMLLGFVLIIVCVLVVGTVMMLSDVSGGPPPP
jgi:uncharacterized membrane protein